MRVAVLGTGVMGAGMVASLAREGHDVTVWNRSPEKAQALVGERVRAVESAAEAGEGAEVLITMLYDVEAVLSVAEPEQGPSFLGSLGPDAVWLQCSTVGAPGVRRLDEAARAHDRVMVDAPVLGTKQPAENGQLVVLTSGSPEAVERAGEVLDAIGSRTMHVGDEIGAASGLKIACNAWIATLTAGVAQAMALAEDGGVDPALFLEAISGTAVDTPYAGVKGKAIAAGEFPVSFALDGLRKDVGLAADQSGSGGSAGTLLDALAEVYRTASERGHGEEDIAAVIAGFRDR